MRREGDGNPVNPDGQWYPIIVSGVVGLLSGSFLNVVAYRLPCGESIVHPGSRCPSCGHRLSIYEIVPLLSFAVQGGHCRHCREKISVRYPLLELATALLFVWTSIHVVGDLKQFTWAIFWLILIAAVGTDWTSMRIPDVITYPGGLIVLLLAGATGVQSWSLALSGAVLCPLILLTVHLLSRGNMGLGDAKLYVAIGAILGPYMGVESLIVASAVGVLVGMPLRLTRRLRAGQRIPFAPMIAVGTLLVAQYGTGWTTAYVHLLGLQVAASFGKTVLTTHGACARVMPTNL